MNRAELSDFEDPMAVLIIERRVLASTGAIGDKAGATVERTENGSSGDRLHVITI